MEFRSETCCVYLADPELKEILLLLHYHAPYQCLFLFSGFKESSHMEVHLHLSIS